MWLLGDNSSLQFIKLVGVAFSYFFTTYIGMMMLGKSMRQWKQTMSSQIMLHAL